MNLFSISKLLLVLVYRAMWGAAQQAGLRQLLTEDLQDGFELTAVRLVNPFEAANNRLIDEVLPPG